MNTHLHHTTTEKPSLENLLNNQNSFWRQAEESWRRQRPGCIGVARTQIHTFSCGVYSSKYMANLDSAGLGPEDRQQCGRQIIYPFQTLIPWLEGRTKTLRRKQAEGRIEAAR